MKEVNMQIQMTLPHGVTPAQLRQYVLDAVRGWKGQYDMRDPLFELDRESVKVWFVGGTVEKRRVVTSDSEPMDGGD